ncbi:Small-conductance mechanosensitive channel [Enhydrobacter aerosaccus]|uniref:Small-conductance mechanosensitive channel n=1 Tax=Enhydrobacter aerosaccus TaxID=225324 RepID=A0A1T4L9X8_9HYPH|nr:mechanosensitive ion channel family protein [Enhydrobacter aerosaccus]SJZ51403.1 Small-conductance mechanosensitive channel [Enhydrobacter aerosaccus]
MINNLASRLIATGSKRTLAVRALGGDLLPASGLMHVKEHAAAGRIMTIMPFVRLLALMISLFALAPGLAQAQTPPAAPAGMTQDQFDALVDAISKSVAEKLKAEGAATPAAQSAPEHAVQAAPPPAAKPAAKPGKGATAPKPQVVKTPLKEGPSEISLFLHSAGTVLSAFPILGEYLAKVPKILNQQLPDGRGPFDFLLLLGIIGLVAVAAESILRGLLRRPRTHLAAATAPERGLVSLISLGSLAALDGLGVLAVWLISEAAVATWFEGSAPQDRLAQAVLHGIFGWRLYVLLFRIVLQPDMPTARLCAVEGAGARSMYLRISAVMFVIILGRIVAQLLIAMTTPTEAFAAYQVLVVPIYLACFFWLVFRSKEAAQQWFSGLALAAPLAGTVARHWIGVASTFFAIMGVTQLYSALSGQVKVGGAMVLTLNLVIGLVIFETLMQAFVRRLDSQLVGHTPASNAPKLPDVVARCVRVAVIIGVGVTIAETWVVKVLGLASPDQWDQITRASQTAAVTLFLAFVLWELFKYFTDPYMARKPKDAAQAIADGDASAAPTTRISTVMPLLRMAVAIAIVLLAVMIALEDFGIDVTPLIAGASIFGIAISFGSQTLVKDIVSGIFYLTDDAFRVGEYIDCGKAKGTVEGFTLRSIKLRHQNGQVHTIPFGQLGQITNFSRDWITVKFNLRFARDTDIEKLRKAAKKIGQEMMEVPEIKSEILAPFKMQGVADIVENALLIRFKFTARPGNPAMIQREAVKRMFNTLPALGIEFAKEGATVILHTGASADAASSPAPAPTAPETQAPASVAAS